ncbi:hypothetical protein OB955_07320 [Halobacteria archaeon AArc-m2/3/4]|uniref:Uncharacterized protein n=1 Tax=Natronoglomus mannanivorans TaxID=2979990 RepID=A0AAP2YWU6_9EURY|nr:hypothetical protein [Halobacteria archaeon AArc-xg1-1]MCU4972547.1 hypothetical protein [Halobacteria archaeon AArc-m2/3/4]
MSNLTDPRPPLPEWILNAYDVLASRVTDADTERETASQSFTRDRAVDLLLTAEALSLESEDANYVLTRLLERGYLYEVDDELRVTEPMD